MFAQRIDANNQPLENAFTNISNQGDENSAYALISGATVVPASDNRFLTVFSGRRSFRESSEAIGVLQQYQFSASECSQDPTDEDNTDIEDDETIEIEETPQQPKRLIASSPENAHITKEYVVSP